MALDVRGTLSSTGPLTAQTIRTVHYLQAQDWMIGLVSGRQPRTMRALAQELNLATPLVAYDSGVITYPHSSVPLRTISLESSVAGPILSAWEAGTSCLIRRETNDGPGIYYSHRSSWSAAMQYLARKGPSIAAVLSLARHRPWVPLRLVVMAHQGTARRARQLALPHLEEGGSRFSDATTSAGAMRSPLPSPRTMPWPSSADISISAMRR